jgi:hypothetical protein
MALTDALALAEAVARPDVALIDRLVVVPSISTSRPVRLSLTTTRAYWRGRAPTTTTTASLAITISSLAVAVLGISLLLVSSGAARRGRG